MTSDIKACATEKPLTSVMEDYLEAIFNLGREKKVVRVRDIAKRMKVKMPSVTSMLNTLSDRGLVHYEKYEYVEMTEDGRDVGREMRRRHKILRKFLNGVLKVEIGTADADACRMEHALSPTTLDSLIDFMEFIQTCPRAGEGWLENFEEYREHGRDPQKCITQGRTFACDFKDRVRSM
jgi:DtxR family Mn-dependent transcriptional regulator